jgi:hypothetical protein
MAAQLACVVHHDAVQKAKHQVSEHPFMHRSKKIQDYLQILLYYTPVVLNDDVGSSASIL